MKKDTVGVFFVGHVKGMDEMELAERLVMNKLIRNELVSFDVEVPDLVVGRITQLETELKQRAEDAKALRIKELLRKRDQLRVKINPADVLSDIDAELHSLQGVDGSGKRE